MDHLCMLLVQALATTSIPATLALCDGHSLACELVPTLLPLSTTPAAPAMVPLKAVLRIPVGAMPAPVPLPILLCHRWLGCASACCMVQHCSWCQTARLTRNATSGCLVPWQPCARVSCVVVCHACTQELLQRQGALIVQGPCCNTAADKPVPTCAYAVLPMPAPELGGVQDMPTAAGALLIKRCETPMR